MAGSRRFLQPGWIMLGGAVLLGLLDRPLGLNLLDPMRGVLVFALLGLGLNVVTGFTGLLHLGMAAFMAIGAYAFAISTCDIYPFQRLPGDRDAGLRRDRAGRDEEPRRDHQGNAGHQPASRAEPAAGGRARDG